MHLQVIKSSGACVYFQRTSALLRAHAAFMVGQKWQQF